MLGAYKARSHHQMQVLHGETRVNALVKGVDRLASKGNQGHVEKTASVAC